MGTRTVEIYDNLPSIKKGDGVGGTINETVTGSFLFYYRKVTRSDTIVAATELTRLGVMPGEKITKIRFKVAGLNTGSQTMLENVRVGVQHTTWDNIEDMPGLLYYADATEVFTAAFIPNPTVIDTWIELAFQTPFTWDGTNNIGFSVCRSNTNGDYTSARGAFYARDTTGIKSKYCDFNDGVQPGIAFPYEYGDWYFDAWVPAMQMVISNETSASLSADATLTATGTVTPLVSVQTGTATLSADATLSATLTNDSTVNIALSAAGDMTATGSFVLNGSVTLDAQATLTASGGTTIPMNTLAGTVTKGGLPVQGATVQAINQSTNQLYNGLTNSSGNYTITVNVGTYHIICSYDDGNGNQFASKSKPFVVVNAP